MLMFQKPFCMQIFVSVAEFFIALRLTDYGKILSSVFMVVCATARIMFKVAGSGIAACYFGQLVVPGLSKINGNIWNWRTVFFNWYSRNVPLLPCWLLKNNVEPNRKQSRSCVYCVNPKWISRHPSWFCIIVGWFHIYRDRPSPKFLI